ncbi:MAG TPA: RDD family protein [Trichormus sp.]|jgi:uncharacterized RDD family membrane protein YckC
MTEIQPNAAPHTQAVGNGVVYAGFWLRFAACGIDLFLACASMIPVALIGAIPYLFFTNEAEGDPNEIMRSLSSAYTAVYVFAIVTASWFYFIVFECSKLQATPGKLVFGLRVTDEHGQRITFLRSAARTASKILSASMMMAGYILAGFTPRKQALHDLIASCLVVRAPQTSLQTLPPPAGSLPQPASSDNEQPPVSAEPAPPQADTEQPPSAAESEQPSKETSEDNPSQTEPVESEQSPAADDGESIPIQLPQEPEPVPAGGEEANQPPDQKAPSPDQPGV